jgi:hypothetical protein
VGLCTKVAPLTERSDRWTLPDGSIQRFRGGLAYRPVVLKLTPEMNRVRTSFGVRNCAKRDRRPRRQRVPRYPSGRRPSSIRARSAVAVAPGGKATLDVRAFEVFVPTRVLIFLLEEVGKPDVGREFTDSRSLGARRASFQPVVWCGFGLLLIGMGMACLWSAHRTEPAPSRHEGHAGEPMRARSNAKDVAGTFAAAPRC